MSKLPRHNNKNNYKLSQGNDDKYAVLKFSACDDKHPLQELNKEELKAFVRHAKKIENMLWSMIKTYPGFKYEPLPEIDKPSSIAKDITLYSMRINEKFRLVGYKQEIFFYIVWFDKNHKES